MPHSLPDILADLKIHRLPSLPHVLIDMMQACQGNRSSFQDLSTIISRDAAISARVVALANSSFFSRGTKINTLDRALLVLGTDTIKTIVITASVQQFFSGFNHDQGQYLKTSWKRSITCALTAKSLAILTSYGNPDEAYLTGLLHNIGELVLSTSYPKQFQQLVKNEPNENERINSETDVFSISHTDLGAHLSRDWGLNEFVADAIEFHHAPSFTILDAHHLVKITYLASLLSDPEPRNSHSLFEAADQLFELNPSLVSEIISKIDSEVSAIGQSLGIDTESNELKQAELDQQKQVALAKQIRNTNLVQSATSEINQAQTKNELGRAFQSALELLFGYRECALFWYETEDNELNLVTPDHPSSVPIRFKVEADRSLVAKAALKKSVLYSKDEVNDINQLTVVDQQIVRAVKGDNLVCIPLYSEDRLFCVLVAGTVQSNQHSASDHVDLLRFFANEITEACTHTLTSIANTQTSLSLHELTLRINEIVHEANNPLTIIGNYLTSLSGKLEDQPEAQDELKVLKEELERTSHILLRLRDIEHSDIDEEPGVEINDEINSLVKLYKSSLFLAHDIQCKLDLDDSMQRNMASRNSIRQVLTNLIKNAVEAMPDGGKISISSTGNVNVDGKDFTEIVVSDNGPGIPSQVLKDLFTPVSSTKGSGHSGLGLSITKNLIKDAHGTISCRSNQSGTSFQILLPSLSQDSE